jgi:hypothetical protein
MAEREDDVAQFFQRTGGNYYMRQRREKEESARRAETRRRNAEIDLENKERERKNAEVAQALFEQEQERAAYAAAQSAEIDRRLRERDEQVALELEEQRRESAALAQREREQREHREREQQREERQRREQEQQRQMQLEASIARDREEAQRRDEERDAARKQRQREIEAERAKAEEQARLAQQQYEAARAQRVKERQQQQQQLQQQQQEQQRANEEQWRVYNESMRLQAEEAARLQREREAAAKWERERLAAVEAREAAEAEAQRKQREEEQRQAQLERDAALRDAEDRALERMREEAAQEAEAEEMQKRKVQEEVLHQEYERATEAMQKAVAEFNLLHQAFVELESEAERLAGSFDASTRNKLDALYARASKLSAHLDTLAQQVANRQIAVDVIWQELEQVAAFIRDSAQVGTDAQGSIDATKKAAVERETRVLLDAQVSAATAVHEAKVAQQESAEKSAKTDMQVAAAESQGQDAAIGEIIDAQSRLEQVEAAKNKQADTSLKLAASTQEFVQHQELVHDAESKLNSTALAVVAADVPAFQPAVARPNALDTLPQAVGARATSAEQQVQQVRDALHAQWLQDVQRAQLQEQLQVQYAAEAARLAALKQQQAVIQKQQKQTTTQLEKDQQNAMAATAAALRAEQANEKQISDLMANKPDSSEGVLSWPLIKWFKDAFLKVTTLEMSPGFKSIVMGFLKSSLRLAPDALLWIWNSAIIPLLGIDAKKYEIEKVPAALQGLADAVVTESLNPDEVKYALVAQDKRSAFSNQFGRDGALLARSGIWATPAATTSTWGGRPISSVARFDASPDVAKKSQTPATSKTQSDAAPATAARTSKFGGFGSYYANNATTLWSKPAPAVTPAATAPKTPGTVSGKYVRLIQHCKIIPRDASMGNAAGQFFDDTDKIVMRWTTDQLVISAVFDVNRPDILYIGYVGLNGPEALHPDAAKHMDFVYKGNDKDGFRQLWWKWKEQDISHYRQAYMLPMRSNKDIAQAFGNDPWPVHLTNIPEFVDPFKDLIRIPAYMTVTDLMDAAQKHALSGGKSSGQYKTLGESCGKMHRTDKLRILGSATGAAGGPSSFLVTWLEANPMVNAMNLARRYSRIARNVSAVPPRRTVLGAAAPPRGLNRAMQLPNAVMMDDQGYDATMEEEPLYSDAQHLLPARYQQDWAQSPSRDPMLETRVQRAQQQRLRAENELQRQRDAARELADERVAVHGARAPERGGLRVPQFRFHEEGADVPRGAPPAKSSFSLGSRYTPATGRYDDDIISASRPGQQPAYDYEEHDPLYEDPSARSISGDQRPVAVGSRAAEPRRERRADGFRTTSPGASDVDDDIPKPDERPTPEDIYRRIAAGGGDLTTVEAARKYAESKGLVSSDFNNDSTVGRQRAITYLKDIDPRDPRANPMSAFKEYGLVDDDSSGRLTNLVRRTRRMASNLQDRRSLQRALDERQRLLQSETPYGDDDELLYTDAPAGAVRRPSVSAAVSAQDAELKRLRQRALQERQRGMQNQPQERTWSANQMDPPTRRNNPGARPSAQADDGDDDGTEERRAQMRRANGPGAHRLREEDDYADPTRPAPSRPAPPSMDDWADNVHNWNGVPRRVPPPPRPVLNDGYPARAPLKPPTYRAAPREVQPLLRRRPRSEGPPGARAADDVAAAAEDEAENVAEDEADEAGGNLFKDALDEGGDALGPEDIAAQVAGDLAGDLVDAAVGDQMKKAYDDVARTKVGRDVLGAINTVASTLSKGAGAVNTWLDKTPVVSTVYNVVKEPFHLLATGLDDANKGISVANKAITTELKHVGEKLYSDPKNNKYWVKPPPGKQWTKEQELLMRMAEEGMPQSQIEAVRAQIQAHQAAEAKAAADAKIVLKDKDGWVVWSGTQQQLDAARAQNRLLDARWRNSILTQQFQDQLNADSARTAAAQTAQNNQIAHQQIVARYARETGKDPLAAEQSYNAAVAKVKAGKASGKYKKSGDKKRKSHTPKTRKSTPKKSEKRREKSVAKICSSGVSRKSSKRK